MKNKYLSHTDYESIITGDGSSSLRDPVTGETFHSTFGAVTESNLVFIQNGLNYFVQNQSTAKINLLEIGFGTGLNALLTLVEACRRSIQIEYTSIDAFPLSPENAAKLNFTQLAEFETFKNDFITFHNEAGIEQTFGNGLFKLKRIHIDLLELEPAKRYFDLIYFDAFSPNVQPELWSRQVFVKLYEALKPGGILVTYSSKGVVKNALRESGFTIERLAGPPGKRHVLRAVKLAD